MAETVAEEWLSYPQAAGPLFCPRGAIRNRWSKRISTSGSCSYGRISNDRFWHLMIQIWVFPKIGVPQNWWFIMENPMSKWMIWGIFPYFWKHPYCIHTLHGGLTYITEVPSCLKVLRLRPERRFCRLGDLSKEVRWSTTNHPAVNVGIFWQEAEKVQDNKKHNRNSEYLKPNLGLNISTHPFQTHLFGWMLLNFKVLALPRWDGSMVPSSSAWSLNERYDS